MVQSINRSNFTGDERERTSKDGGSSKATQVTREATGRCPNEKRCPRDHDRCGRRTTQNQNQKKVWTQTVTLLRQMYGQYSVRYFCALFGKSRQGWYELIHHQSEQQLS